MQPAGGVQALPELALRGRSFAEGYIGQLVAVPVATRSGCVRSVKGGLGAPDRG